MNGAAFFEPDRREASLKRRSVRGGVAVMLGTLGSGLIETAGTIVLARLLAPRDFGLIAMVAVAVNFVVLFRDFGLSSATIWKQDLSAPLVTNLFWINLAVGAALTAVTAGLAVPVAWFYREPRLVGVTLLLAPTFVVTSAILQQQALLRRSMQFGRLSALQAVAAAAGVLSAVLLAWRGAGYWSLVAQRLVSAAATAAGIWLLCPWRPGLPARAAGLGDAVRFGGNLTAGRFTQYLMRNADNLLIGHFVGGAALGIYTKAYALLLLPMRQVGEPFSTVVVPSLSRLQAEPERYRAYYRRALGALTALSMPAAAFAAAEAPDVIGVVLGPQWDASVSVFRLLAPAAFIGSFSVATSWVFISLGHVDRLLRMQLATAVFGLAGMLIGVRWGVTGVAVAVSAGTILGRLPQLLYCFAGTPVSMRDLGAAICRPAAASLLAALILWSARLACGAWHGPAALAAKLAVYGLLYAGLFCALPGGTAELKQSWRALKELRAGPGPGKGGGDRA